jgi:hypothetical protein
MQFSLTIVFCGDVPSFTTSTHWPDYKVQTSYWNVENKNWKTDDSDDMFYNINAEKNKKI